MCSEPTRRSPATGHEQTEDAMHRLYHQARLEKQYFETLVMKNPAAIIAVGLSENVLSWNPAAERLFGYKQAEAVGQNIDELITTEAIRAEAVAYSRQAVEGEPVHAITRRKRKDGTLVEVEVFALPVTVEGTEIAAFAIYHDITELQQARREAEAANRAKSAFLAMMSHEIRTPMNGIIGMTSLLLDTTLTPEQCEYAETIRASSEALLTIINDILDFSKIEAGKMELENQPFDLRECIEGTLDLVAAQAREKRLELACLIAPEVPAALMGDVTRLRQILLNLLSNALKFTERGEVVVSVDVEAEAEGAERGEGVHVHRFHFQVRDTGIGIPADRIGRLFRSFSQVDASTARRYGGTGLGLAISRRLAEMMGGAMWVESTVGEGSVFHFTMQAEAAPAHTRMYLHSDQPHLRGRRVLIVDDNATNRRVLVAQTRSWSMIPRETAFPQEALEWIGRGDLFDLVLLDMQMPDMDGLALAVEIRRHRDADSLPLVMLSSLGRREAGADTVDFAAYLTKPIKQSVLYNTMVEVLAGLPAPDGMSDRLAEPQFDVHMAERLPLRILLAEDHAINQKLALQMLRKMGYRADVAGNGLEALEALERQPYDVVLMDVQMPEMDGLEATRQIHQKWGRDRPHIIAMTANAMQGDREECLAAGMDDYVSKPVLIQDLQMALERWGQKEPASLPAESAQDAAPVTVDWAVLDGLHALQVEGEPDFVQETIAMYLDDTPTLIEAIREAITQRQADGLRHAAHALKGNSNSLGARRMGALSLSLEELGRGGDVESATPLLAELEREFERVRQALQSWKLRSSSRNSEG
jgi:PAS domain S-box-containing protein